MPNIEMPAGLPLRAEATYVVGFGDAVREHVTHGDCDHERAENYEAAQWTFSAVYYAGYEAGAAWAAQR